MNFIEMRKDFEAFYAEKEQAIKDVLKFEGVKGVAYDVWKASKLHTEEMAKQTVKVLAKTSNYRSSYPFVLSLFEGETFNCVLEDFKTEDDAKEWAKTNGYRVVE